MRGDKKVRTSRYDDAGARQAGAASGRASVRRAEPATTPACCGQRTHALSGHRKYPSGMARESLSIKTVVRWSWLPAACSIALRPQSPGKGRPGQP